ncbi:MAG: hypothetical protein AVO39_09700 [delta proteobacterium MLS_D]|nr:MAG: hypothetical protein AVO39_09700 [delta proteobacterium MLS_D]
MQSFDLEYTGEQDVFYNYCLWEYEPPVPAAGKLRSVNLLKNSFDVLGADGAMHELVDDLRRGIGPGNTVWGVKKVGDFMGWEYYFYDYRRLERERSLSKVLKVMAPRVRARIAPNENIPYFMFSLDVDDALLNGVRDLDCAHIYIGNPGSTVSSGICYAQTDEGMKLENFYFFFHPADQMDEIDAKVLCSTQIDGTKIPRDAVLRPELRDCSTICCANKQHSDCIYFSGITIDQFLFFLRWMRYPAPLVAFVEEQYFRLDHLLFDVGFDYRMENDRLAVLKSGYYGNF